MMAAPELVFVTGAGSGIGRATARHFARMGATAISTDIDASTAEETADLIRAEGGTAHAYRLDVADAAAFEEIAERVRADHGVPDVAVNNAGMAFGATVLEHTVADWHRMLDVHLMGVVHGSRLFGAQMVQRGRGGHIVNTSSVMGFTPAPFASSYCTAKAGIKMLSECLRAELAPQHIGVSAMCFGLISTNIAAVAELPGTNTDLVDRGKALSARLLPVLGANPDKAARAIASAVRRNRTVVPVRPEAYALYGLSRIAPSALRGVMTLAARIGTRENSERLASLLNRRAV